MSNTKGYPDRFVHAALSNEMQSSSVLKLVVAAVVVISMIVLSNHMIKTSVFPSLGEFIASSTDESVSGNVAISSNDVANVQLIPVQSYSTTTIRVPRGSILAQIANDPTKRELGLSGRTSLPSGSGLLFIFPTPGKYGFWMKDMNFPIDIIWIRPDRTVAGVARDISPSTFPELFYPPSDIQFVLELNAGKSDFLGVATGTVINL